jgi:hypothetical protein
VGHRRLEAGITIHALTDLAAPAQAELSGGAEEAARGRMIEQSACGIRRPALHRLAFAPRPRRVAPRGQVMSSGTTYHANRFSSGSVA